jgi:hypothetical protein
MEGSFGQKKEASSRRRLIDVPLCSRFLRRHLPPRKDGNRELVNAGSPDFMAQ